MNKSTIVLNCYQVVLHHYDYEYYELYLYWRFFDRMKDDKKLHYKEHKSLFQKIKVEERSEWIQNMLKIQQLKGDYPLYRKDYPLHGKWMHKGCELHYYYYLNAVQPAKGIIFFFPGLNSHANSSAYWSIGVAEKCHMDVYALDYKNFGRSGGEERGYIDSADEIIEQAEDFVQFIVAQQKEKKKVYISGLSMGGAVCFKLATRHPERYTGVIFLSPALKQNKEVTPFMKKVGRVLGSWFPRLKIVEQTYGSATKYDQTERIKEDPYVYKGKVVPGTIKMILDLMEEIENSWDQFTSSFILIQSGVDKMVDPFLGIDFEKTCKSQDKTVIYFKDMWHAVFAEEEIPQVVEATIEWLQPRVLK